MSANTAPAPAAATVLTPRGRRALRLARTLGLALCALVIGIVIALSSGAQASAGSAAGAPADAATADPSPAVAPGADDGDADPAPSGAADPATTDAQDAAGPAVPGWVWAAGLAGLAVIGVGFAALGRKARALDHR